MLTSQRKERGNRSQNRSSELGSDTQDLREGQLNQFLDFKSPKCNGDEFSSFFEVEVGTFKLNLENLIVGKKFLMKSLLECFHANLFPNI